MIMPSSNTVTSVINYIAMFLITVLGGLQGFNWLSMFDAETSLKIVSAISLVGLLAKAWIATAQSMAKTMTPDKP